jgi:peroxiredoxin
MLAARAIFSPYALTAEIGSKIGNLQLVDTSGGMQSLQSHSGQIVVLVFWSFKCPVSLAYNDRIEELRSKYAGKNVGVLAIASGANETPSEIQANVANLKIKIPVLLDPEGNAAKKLGATHMPSFFVIDGNNVLGYKGALDNNKRTGEKGRISYLDNALDSLLSGHPVPVEETRAFGCSIKSGN